MCSRCGRFSLWSVKKRSINAVLHRCLRKEIAVGAGLSAGVSSLVSVLHLITRSRDVSVEEQNAAGSIPSARVIASNAAWPPCSFIYSSVRPSGVELLMGGGGRWLDLTTKRKENHCLPLDSGRLLFLAKAAIITRATSNKIVQARLGN